MAVNLEGRSTATKMVGVDVAMPVALAPTGLAGMQHADGEILAAKAANCGALMLTLDPQILGQRHKDLKNGLSAPPRLTIPNIVNMMTKPRWCLGMLGTRRRQFGNIVGHVKGVGDMGSLSDWTAASAPVRTC